MEVKEIKKKLKKSLDKQRYQHTLGVMYTAGCLAMANGYSIEKAMLAGLLHDCAKCLSTEKKIGLCVKKNIDITEVEISNPGLLHAKAGMVLAEEEYGIKDAQILHAIRVHTTGEADMGLLDKILFVADYIEPNRYHAPYHRCRGYQSNPPSPSRCCWSRHARQSNNLPPRTSHHTW